MAAVGHSKISVGVAGYCSGFWPQKTERKWANIFLASKWAIGESQPRPFFAASEVLSDFHKLFLFGTLQRTEPKCYHPGGFEEDTFGVSCPASRGLSHHTLQSAPEPEMDIQQGCAKAKHKLDIFGLFGLSVQAIQEENCGTVVSYWFCHLRICLRMFDPIK